jgi:hypothetical protein
VEDIKLVPNQNQERNSVEDITLQTDDFLELDEDEDFNAITMEDVELPPLTSQKELAGIKPGNPKNETKLATEGEPKAAAGDHNERVTRSGRISRRPKRYICNVVNVFTGDNLFM